MNVTHDKLLDGRVSLFQPEKGLRATTDSLLLAAALPAHCNAALELGCGAGGALLPAAWRLGETRFTGLDIDSELVGLARCGVEANGFSARVSIEQGDAGALPADWENRFDLVFANPPYFRSGEISPPGEGKSRAYLESLDLIGWIGAMLFALKPKATLVVIHRAAELPALMSALYRRAGEITILPVRPCPGAAASRILIRARKGLRAGPARLLAGIDLHSKKGGPAGPALLALTSGGALDWN